MSGGFAVRVAVAVASLTGGAVVGTSAVVLHGYWWGLLVGVAAIGTLLWAVPGGWWRRLPVALGWCAAVLLLAVERPEGDYLVESSARVPAVGGGRRRAPGRRDRASRAGVGRIRD